MKYFILLWVILFNYTGYAQPKPVSSSEILLGLQKLEVTGGALYIAAHPDDENTRLISYLANEKKLRTGYLSLTRGDGGQNLIGSELGIELGLIRTQELLAARRIDGAEQFFTRAFDFGYSKNPEEAFEIWNKEKILYDAVWVIRKFKPDIIIARFPEDSRAGHGHHSASGIIAREAAVAAADPQKFPEQFNYGLQPWKVTRVLWNTFSFGRTSTISEDQFKINVGNYNPLLGRGYGEIAAESRSQHKSQGFGVPNSYGLAYEYFVTVMGEEPQKELTDGIDINWQSLKYPAISKTIQSLLNQFDHNNPSASVPALIELYKEIEKEIPAAGNSRIKYLLNQKLEEVKTLILQASGIYAEAITDRQFAISGDSMKVSFGFVNRGDSKIDSIKFIYNGQEHTIKEIPSYNTFTQISSRIKINALPEETQPYWLKLPKAEGHFNISDPQQTGLAEAPDERVILRLNIGGTLLSYYLPLEYKYTDPVKGEIRQKTVYLPGIQLKVLNEILLTGTGKDPKPVTIQLIPADDYGEQMTEFNFKNGNNNVKVLKKAQFQKNIPLNFQFLPDEIYKGNLNAEITPEVKIINGENSRVYSESVRLISYDHIPDISYLKSEQIKIIQEKINISDSRIGYIPGAGDAVAEALHAMGYSLTILSESDMYLERLQSFDAIVTGIRAYNTNAWLMRYYPVLMNYIKNGGNFIMQYNTSLQQEQINSGISPYKFFIGRGRVTEENSPVKFLIPGHQVLNYPNKLNNNDFNGWVQERGLYFAQDFGKEFEAPLGMADKNESILNGSLLISKYGKGNFVYTGLAFFRQLPAGVPGAYKLFANIIALNKYEE